MRNPRRGLVGIVVRVDVVCEQPHLWVEDQRLMSRDSPSLRFNAVDFQLKSGWFSLPGRSSRGTRDLKAMMPIWLMFLLLKYRGVAHEDTYLVEQDISTSDGYLESASLLTQRNVIKMTSRIIAGPGPFTIRPPASRPRFTSQLPNQVFNAG